MSEGRAAPTAAHRVGSGAGRLKRAWQNLPHERRLAAGAAIGLFLTLFLPWYQETVVVAGASKTLETAGQSLNGWAAFSFVEAAVLLVAAGVLTLLFQRAEGRAFHLPGGDGWVIMAAGSWTSVLVIWRIFDKQGTSNHGQIANSSGIEWGIFVALGVAVFLAYAGSRVRAAHQPEPPLPGEDAPSSRSPGAGDGGSRSPSPGAGADPGDGGSRSTSPGEGPGDGGSRSPSPGEGPGDGGSRSPSSAQDDPRSWSPRDEGPPAWSPGKNDPPIPEWPSTTRPVGWLSAPTGDRAGSPRPEELRGEPRPEELRGELRSEEPRAELRSEEPRVEPRPEEPRGGVNPEAQRRESGPDGPRGEPDPEGPRGPRPVRAPRPYPTGEAPAQSEPPPAVPPSTPAARRRKPADEQLTIPLEREE